MLTLLTVSVVLGPVLLVLLLEFLEWKGWVTKRGSENFQFALVSLLALYTIGRAITQSLKTHDWSQMAILVLALATFWVADLRERKKDHTPCRPVSIAGYVMAMTLLNH